MVRMLFQLPEGVRRQIRTTLTIGSIWMVAGSGLGAEAPKLPGKGIDLHGRLHHLGERAGTEGIVIVVLSTECPISNAYLPKLKSIHQRYSRRGIEFYGLISDPAVSRQAGLAHRQEYGIAFPILFDQSLELRKTLGATHSPQAFVLRTNGQPVYAGAIDDQFTSLGKRRNDVRQNFLEERIKALLSKESLEFKATKTIGCRLEDRPTATADAPVTFCRDIAPIIFTHCSSCHRPEQSAPFPLITFEDVSRHAEQIVEVTHSRFMPPWKPLKGYGDFRDEQRLSQAQVQRIADWVRLGKALGNPDDLPATPSYATRWKLGEPDVILRMIRPFDIPASGPDIHQNFVIATRIREDRLVSAVEFRPGTPQSIHHASFFFDDQQIARGLDEEDPNYGYEGSGGTGFVNVGALRSWLPGQTPRRLPKGMGRLIERGSDLVFEVHYRCVGKPLRDQSELGVYYAPRRARQAVLELQVADKRLEIPAGTRRHHHRAIYQLPVETILLDCAPHMHFLGKEMKAQAKLPDGTEVPLIYIDDWDFNWQGQYVYRNPIRLPSGTTIEVDAWYDNSADNPMNPNSPPKTVRWGEESWDEMNICHFQSTCDSADDFRRLARDLKRRDEEQKQMFDDLPDHPETEQ